MTHDPNRPNQSFSRRTGFILAALIAATLSSTASAATVLVPAPAGSTTDWLQNWTNATVSDGTFLLPAASVPDTVIINQNRRVEVTAPVTIPAGDVVVNNTNIGTFDAYLDINAGGSLTTGNVTVAGNSDPGFLTVQGGTLTSNLIRVNPTGVFDVTSGVVNLSPTAGVALDLNDGIMNVSGGTVTLTDPAPGGGTFPAIGGVSSGTLNLTGGSFVIAGATAATDTIAIGPNDVYNISGGTFSVCGGQFISGSSTAGVPVFNITGSSSTVEIDRLNLGPASRATDFNFVMDAAGVTPVSQCAGTYTNLAAANVTVDGSAYTGPMTAGTYIPLFDYANVVGTIPTYNVTGLGTQGTNWDFVWDTTTNLVGIEFLAPVPEPSSLALLLPCLALLAFRRRR